MKLTDAENITPQHVMLFGPSFSGKTELAGRLAEHFNLLWFDLEKGRSVLFKLPPAYKEKINIIAIPDSAGYPIAAETVPKVLKTAETGKAIDICTKHGKVGCMICKREGAYFDTVNLSTLGLDTIVVFDSGTQFTNSLLANITKDEAEDYKLQLDDWGALKFLTDKNMSRVQVAPYHTVWISHEEEVEMVDKKKKIVPVMGSSKSSRNVARYFDHVIYCQVKNKKHMSASATTYTTNILTGSRTDVSIEDLETPSLLAIFKPELYPTDSKKAVGSTSSTSTGVSSATKANSILNRLKKQ